MSLIARSYCLIVLSLVMIRGSHAQFFTDQGLFSGSGLTVMPTATVVPAAEVRLQYSRVDYLKGGRRGLNVIGLSAGFSSSLEAYMRVSGEQVGGPQSLVAYGFGGKFRLPVLVPVVRRLALWAEATASDQYHPTALYPSDAFRAGVTATFDSNGIHPTILIGFTTLQDRTRPLVGAGMTIAAGNHAQVGVEFVHGYLGLNSAQMASTASFRVFPNISLHASPGYLSMPGASTWTFSFGISCTTSDVDFHPVYEEKKENEFILPSIEEIEKERKQEPSGDGSVPGGSQEEGTGDDGSSPKGAPGSALQPGGSLIHPVIERSVDQELISGRTKHE